MPSPPDLRPPQLPSPSPLLSTMLLLLTIIPPSLSSSSSSSSSNPCIIPPPKPIPCPPFNSSADVPYPFSTVPGCGHPDFHLHCSSPHSLISINNNNDDNKNNSNLSFFVLLSFFPNSSSLLLSLPIINLPLLLLHHPINLSGSPFRFTNSTCSRFQNLIPCPCLCLSSSSLLYCGDSAHRREFPACRGNVLRNHLSAFLREGFLVQWVDDGDDGDRDRDAKCRVCQSRNGSCGFDSSDPDKRFVCYESEFLVQQPKRITGLVVFCLVFLLFCFVCSAAIAIFLLLFRKKRLHLLPLLSSSSSSNNAASFFLRQSSDLLLLPPMFTYEQLQSATNSFSKELKIGDGGFGSVYIGHLPDGRTLAVKHLHRCVGGGGNRASLFSAKSFCNEILILSKIRHPNLVTLHGYCSDPRGLLLVYDYVPNGTLFDHLHNPNRNRNQILDGQSIMNWRVRLEIALQIASVIEYLHFSVKPPIVHRDITTANIFLDENMVVKIGDFGLSRLLMRSAEESSSEMCVWTGPQGTPGYLDPDYYKSFRLTEKSDVYSFGVVMMELVTGRRAVGLVDWVVGRIQTGRMEEVVDEAVLVAEGEMESVAAVAELAFRCVAAEKDDRPDARVIVAELLRILGR